MQGQVREADVRDTRKRRVKTLRMRNMLEPSRDVRDKLKFSVKFVGDLSGVKRVGKKPSRPPIYKLLSL